MPTDADNITEEQAPIRPSGAPAPSRGVAVVWRDGHATCDAHPISDRLVIGRTPACGLQLDESGISRQHAELSWKSGLWTIRDLASRNGTFVNERRVSGTLSFGEGRVVRCGNAIFLPRASLDGLDARTSLVDGDRIEGAAMRRAIAEIEEAARAGETVLVSGESGTGKEYAATRYHAASPFARGPFVALNGSAIPETLAELLLFGAVKGAHSQADRYKPGYFEQARDGVLFLDELGEMPVAIQPKLLRALETKSVTPLGGAAPVKLSLGIVCGTNRAMASAVRDGKFRLDLLARLSEYPVELPALRDRREEIPFFVERFAEGLLTPSSAFVAECLQRRWAANVRELRTAVRVAARRSRSQGFDQISPDLLPAPLAAEGERPEREKDERASFEALFEELGGQVGELVKATGKSKSTVYEMIKRYGLKGDR